MIKVDELLSGNRSHQSDFCCDICADANPDCHSFIMRSGNKWQAPLARLIHNRQIVKRAGNITLWDSLICIAHDRRDGCRCWRQMLSGLPNSLRKFIAKMIKSALVIFAACLSLRHQTREIITKWSSRLKKACQFPQKLRRRCTIAILKQVL